MCHLFSGKIITEDAISVKREMLSLFLLVNRWATKGSAPQQTKGTPVSYTILCTIFSIHLGEKVVGL
jgi:hypothetical protein